MLAYASTARDLACSQADLSRLPGRPQALRRACPRSAPLSGDVAAKVKAAAEKKVPGGSAERVETDVDHGSPYEAHIRKSNGTELEVLVNESFEVTAVNTMQHR